MPGNLRVQAISGHAGAAPGSGAQRQERVAKLIDTTTCIGCKACEVACLEWNDLPFRHTTFDNTYQTMPQTEWNYWNLIKFNEHSNADGSFQWLMRKDQCMHCADPGCLAACPADNAIVQYQNGIVDFQQEYCIGCQYCVTGCPFNIPRFNPATKKMFKCTLCTDRVSQGLEPACIKACPTGCLHFGTKEDMTALAQTRAQQLRRAHGAHQCRSLRPGGSRRDQRDLRAARYRQSGSVRRAAGESAGAVGRAAVERTAEVAGQCGHDRRTHRGHAPLPALRSEEGGRAWKIASCDTAWWNA